MGHDRVTTVDHLRVVTSLIEHTHIDTEHVCVVDRTAHTTLIRRDDHHVVLVNVEVLNMCEDRLDELVGAGDVIEAVLRNRIHDTWIMCIEGDEVLNAHRMQLLEHHRTVEGLTAGTLVLAGLIHERHDDVDALRLTGGRCDHTLQIAVVVVRGHVVHLAEQAVGL